MNKEWSKMTQIIRIVAALTLVIVTGCATRSKPMQDDLFIKFFEVNTSLTSELDASEQGLKNLTALNVGMGMKTSAIELASLYSEYAKRLRNAYSTMYSQYKEEREGAKSEAERDRLREEFTLRINTASSM